MGEKTILKHLASYMNIVLCIDYTFLHICPDYNCSGVNKRLTNEHLVVNITALIKGCCDLHRGN